MSVDHYENFPVASVLCPQALRPAVAAIYGFARTADDLADEGETSPAERLADLAAYRADLQALADGAAPSSRWAGVFTALRPVIETHRAALPLLADLLSAFEQDVVQHDYADRAMLLDYCRRSANPVGRLLLMLYGIDDPTSLRQSDAVCSALQLANFWQDLGVDTRRGRLYAPATDCQRHGVDPERLRAGHDDGSTRALVRDLVGWTRELMQQGAPLAVTIPGRAGWELRLVVQGGLRILDKIEALDFGTLQTRPTLKAPDAMLMLWRALWMRPPTSLVARQA